MNYRLFSKSYTDCKIDENSIIPIWSFKDDHINEGSALIQIYTLDSFLLDKKKLLPPFIQ